MRMMLIVLYFHWLVWYNLSHATVAQMVEQTFRKRQVMGPIPIGGSISFQMADRK